MNGNRKILLYLIFVVMIFALAGIGSYYWYNNTYFVSTDDASVTGDLIKISPQISGRLLEFDAEEGDRVIKGQILGRQEVINASDAGIEQSIIRAPIDGVILKRQCTVGEVESTGQTLAIMTDPRRLHINVNIEETKLGRIQPGQAVDITVDQFRGKRFSGRVKSVGQAANSSFSLLPTSTSGTFTKVVQKIPVKIEFDQHNVKLLPGTNAVIKIRVR